MSNFLPAVENGRLMAVDDGDNKGMREVFELLPVMKKVYAKKLIANQGYTLKKALEAVGVLICEREPKTKKVPEYNEKHDE